jgi:hypothetical protein
MTTLTQGRSNGEVQASKLAEYFPGLGVPGARGFLGSLEVSERLVMSTDRDRCLPSVSSGAPIHTGVARGVTSVDPGVGFVLRSRAYPQVRPAVVECVPISMIHFHARRLAHQQPVHLDGSVASVAEFDLGYGVVAPNLDRPGRPPKVLANKRQVSSVNQRVLALGERNTRGSRVFDVAHSQHLIPQIGG